MKPKILFITPLPPPVHGSAMVSKFIQDSKIINQEFDCDFVNLSTSRKMDEIQSLNLKKVLRLVGICFTVFWKLLTNRYDLCYCAIACFGMPFLKDAPVVLLCKLFGRKVLIHQHNKGMHNYCNRKVYKHLYRLVYKNSKVMLLSWRLYDDISEVVNKEQVVICPNGVAPIDRVGSDKMAVDSNHVCRLLYLSNLIPTKGCNVLLDALRILKDKGVPFVCDFIGGDCPEQSADDFVALIHQKQLEGSAFYRGKKYGVEKENFYRNADIFVFPTFYSAECFPLVLLDTMQYSLPCISTSEAAIPDIVEDGETGFIVHRNNAEALADRIELMIAHPEKRIAMGKNGKEKYQKEFTLNQFEERMKEVLNSIIKNDKDYLKNNNAGNAN